MSFQNLIINSTDVQRSIDFYTEFLEAEVVAEPTPGGALLDLVTGTLEIRDGVAGDSTWVPDDLQLGFRHVGFKVDRVDPRAELLKSADIPFHLDPLDAEGGVRICFFFDPDGTLLEFVEGDLQYASTVDPEGVAAERALGVPRAVGVNRPDRMAELIDDRQVARPLEDLKRLAAVDAARRPQREAFAPRVGGGAGGEVLLAPLERRRLIWDGTAIDDAQAGRRVLSHGVRLEVVVERPERAPDT